MNTFRLSLDVPLQSIPIGNQTFKPEYIRDTIEQRGFLLYSLVRAFRARNIFETGTGPGVSSIAMACAQRDMGFDDGRIITVDNGTWKEGRLACVANLEAAGVADRVSCHLGPALDIGPAIVRDHGPFDFVHIDGDHAHPHPRLEFEMVEPFLLPGAAVLFHDTDLGPTKRALDEVVAAHPNWERLTLPIHSEMTILRKPIEWREHHERHSAHKR